MEARQSRISILIAATLCILLVKCPRLLASPDSQTLGAGWDTATGQMKQVWVRGTQGDDSAVKGGDIYVRLIRSQAELQSALNLNFSAKMKGVAYAWDAKMDFVHSQSLSSSSLYLLIESRVTCYRKFFRSAQLDPNIAALLETGEDDRFLDRCGDRFISAEVVGRELYGVLTINNYSNQSYDNVAASLGGRYAHFQTSSQFSKALRQMTEGEQIECHLRKFGVSSPLSLDAANADSLITTAQKFFDELGDVL